jgi:hypothetical protein
MSGLPVCNEIVLPGGGVCNLPVPQEVRILYKNWKGEIAWRRILPLHIAFESTEWHPARQWILHAHDLDKDAPRGFAVADILRWEVGSLVAG